MNKKITNVLVVLGIILIATNMRVSLTLVGPIIELIQKSFHLSSSLAGLLTTLPILCFAIISPLAPLFAKRFGNERMLWFGLLFLIIGLSLRSLLAVFGLFIGTVIIGVAIALFNVLLPSFMKQKFPYKVGLMTGLYTTVMGIWASIGSGFSHPLAETMSGGWRSALLFPIVLALLTFVVWIPQLSSKQEISHHPQTISQSNRRLWKSRLAWSITLFMGFQSFGFYVTITWLPSILMDNGMNPTTAGWLLSLLQLISLPATFLAPVIADRLANQQKITLFVSVLALVGYIGLLSSNYFILYIAIALIGIGQGASISLALSFIALRSSSVEQASSLSGMVQSVAYLIAACGPVLWGFLYDITHSWTLPIFILITITVLMTIAGYKAGKNQYVLPD